MYLEESPYQRDQLINIDQLIGRALDHGVDLGENHRQSIENYVSNGLLPRLLNGEFPATALDRLISIDKMVKEGSSLEEIQKLLKEERRKFLKRPMDLSTLVDAYKGASKSLLMLGSIGLLIFFGSYFVVNLPESGVKSSVTKPVGRVLAQFIKAAKPTNSTSTDPLGLTNVSKVITINEKQEVTIQKTILASDTIPTSTTNQLLSNESITVDNLEVKNILSQEITFPNLSGSGNACVLTLDIAQVLSCNKDLLWTSSTIKDIADISVPSIDGVKNNAGDIDFVAGSGITITGSDTNNSITFSASGGSSNAELLDSVDSTSFLRSDTSDNYTSGTLTLDAGTTLSVLGTFTCTACVNDSAVSDTITASNYLPLSGGTMAGNIDLANNLVVNIGASGTDFTSGGGLNIATDLDVNGHAAIGSGATVLTSFLLNINETSSLAGARGIYLSPTFTPSASTTVNSLHNEPTMSPTGGTTHQFRGEYDRLVIGGSATILLAYGIFIDTPSISGSSVTNLYGLYIADQTGATTNYQIYQAGATGTNYFNAGTSTFGRVATGNDTLYGAVIEGSLCVDDTTASCPAGPTAGAIYVENSVGTGNVSAFDISEYYPASEPVEKGDLVIVDPNSVATVKRSNQSYQQTLLGIVATDPAFVIDENSITFGKTAGNNFNPLKPYIALAGRVPVKVSTENGAILPGDYLTSSSIPGTAMKATESGPVIGKALESFDQVGVGKVLVFVTNSYYSKPLANQSENSEFNLQVSELNLDTIILGENQIKLGSKGNIEIIGNIALEGSLRISKTLYAESVETSQLTLSKLNVDPSAGSVGSATLLAGQTKVVVKSSLVNSTSRIFTSALNFTSNQPLIITNKSAGDSFLVEIEQPLDHDIKFDWWIVN